MTMAGQGVLAFWHDVAAGSEGEFDQWHLREHIPERVAVPGFLRARRYTTLGEPPRYFYFYETESVDTLQSPAYLARLADPTPWTRRTMPVVRNNKRTACRVVESRGAGLGGVIATLELGPAPGREEELLRRMVEHGPLVDGVTGRQTATVDGLAFDRHAEVLTRVGQIVTEPTN